MFTSCPREMMLCTVHTIYILQTKWRGACVHVQSELIQYNSFIKTILFFICWWIEWSTDNRIEEAISVRYFIKVEAAGWEKAERDGDEVRDLNVRMYVKRGAAQQQWSLAMERVRVRVCRLHMKSRTVRYKLPDIHSHHPADNTFKQSNKSFNKNYLVKTISRPSLNPFLQYLR